jgi:hypothetical protein
MAQRGSGASHLVGRDLLALAGATEDHAPIDPALPHRPGHGGADRGVVHGLLGPGSEVLHLVPELLQVLDEVLLEGEAGVIGTDGHPHRA